MGFLDSIFRRDKAQPESQLEPQPYAGLSDEQRRQWEEDGFLILRNYIPPSEIAEVLAIVDRQWTAREFADHDIDILSGVDEHKIFKVGDVPIERRGEVYKLNNLFARSASIRSIALSARLKPVLVDLLDGEPLICNSLNFERGSQQPCHLDTWYMPPPVDDMMVAASIALEDVDAANGPMMFYPGSHKIPMFRFSNGLQNMVSAEAPGCGAHLQHHIAEMGLELAEFSGKAGDIFIWHARLFHGGSAIRDMNRTRNSMVVHYWRAQDLPEEKVRRDGHGTFLGHTLRGEIQF